MAEQGVRDPHVPRVGHASRTFLGRTFEQRFWDRIERTDDGHWLWEGPTQSLGYGMVRTGPGERKLASHVAWELVNGPIPDGLEVIHGCPDGIKRRLCVAPTHLRLGDRRAIARDTADRGVTSRTMRHNWILHPESYRGERHPCAKLREADIPVIRSRLAAGEGPLAISRDYPVSESSIRLIAKGRNWAWVP